METPGLQRDLMPWRPPSTLKPGVFVCRVGFWHQRLVFSGCFAGVSMSSVMAFLPCLPLLFPCLLLIWLSLLVGPLVFLESDCISLDLPEPYMLWCWPWTFGFWVVFQRMRRLGGSRMLCSSLSLSAFGLLWRCVELSGNRFFLPLAVPVPCLSLAWCNLRLLFPVVLTSKPPMSKPLTLLSFMRIPPFFHWRSSHIFSLTVTSMQVDYESPVGVPGLWRTICMIPCGCLMLSLRSFVMDLTLSARILFGFALRREMNACRLQKLGMFEAFWPFLRLLGFLDVLVVFFRSTSQKGMTG